METAPITSEAHAMSRLLEAAGNCRQNTNQELNLHPVSDSLCSEQKKLRHVLDWAHRFLCYGSEVCQEFCRADGLVLAADRNEKTKRKKEETSSKEDHVIIVELEEKKLNSAPVLLCNNNDHDNSNDCLSEPQKEPAGESLTAKPSFQCHLQIPSHLSVYEKYQLCVEQFQNLRLKQNQVSELGCFTESSTKVLNTSKESVAPVEKPAPPMLLFKPYSSRRKTEFKKPLNEKTQQGVSAECVKTAEAAEDKVINSLKAFPNEEEDDGRNTNQGGSVHGANNTGSKDGPAGVPLCDRWLCLPDEVWLFVLSLLPHSDLCRVSQVCSRLHTLTTDRALWKHVTIENSTLSERWLVLLGKRRPLSLCLYSCSGLSVASHGLEKFFTQCRNYLEEVKVISCTGAGLHGDRILPLIGQLCDHVTTVDVSWSGATDTGVKALSGGCARLRLKSIILNGCHVTDHRIKKLIVRHKESLCKLEVFGCQYLTPSCLESIYQMCPGLKHLNIGQVPKVNAHSLNAMTSHLKCLISLNLTGLQAVTDDAVATLLQNCVKLQSLNLSACPGVTDLTLHHISRYTSLIRSLDVRGCKAVTDAGVQSLSLGCRRLQYLDLSSTSTGNRGVNLLTNYCSGHLHTVKLSFCRISSANILKLCRRGKRLRVLHLYGCARPPTERQIREVNPNVQVYPLP